MSVVGLSSSTLSQTILQANSQQQSEYQQLGQALQSGNLTQAQQDYATLTQTAAAQNQIAASAQIGANSPLAQIFNTLDQAIQSGNLTGAEQAFTSIAQEFEPASNQNQSQTNPITQAFNDLGQALKSGNLSAAQKAYGLISQTFNTLGQAFQSGSISEAQQALTTLQQNLQQYALNGSTGANTAGGTGTTAASNVLNVTA